METDKSCSLKFKNYFVNSVEFKTNTEFDAEENVKVKFNFNSKIEYEKDSNHADVLLSVNIFDEKEFDKSPFILKIVITGQFLIEGEFKKSLLEQNAVAILFPYIRSLVSLYTTNANFPALILPPINVVAYIQNKYSDKNNNED
jgi:preprotein translocase subunit SecB